MSCQSRFGIPSGFLRDSYGIPSGILEELPKNCRRVSEELPKPPGTNTGSYCQETKRKI